MTPYIPVEVHRCFWGTYCFHIQGQEVGQSNNKEKTSRKQCKPRVENFQTSPGLVLAFKMEIRYSETPVNFYLSIHRHPCENHVAESFLRSRQLLVYSRISQYFMEPEGSLQCSQEIATGPYPQINPVYTTISLQSILILSTYLLLGPPSGLFQALQPEPCMHFSSSLHTQSISSS
jgi:hypothetical protein